MKTFEVVVQPASPRLAAMLGDALKAEGIEVQYASGSPVQESRGAVEATSLGLNAVTLIVMAADSASVHRAIEKVSERVGGGLKSKVQPRHKK